MSCRTRCRMISTRRKGVRPTSRLSGSSSTSPVVRSGRCPSFLAALVTAWYRGLLRMALPNERACLLTLIPPLGVYIVIDNLSSYTNALALRADLGVLLIRPSLVMDGTALAAGQMPQPAGGNMSDRPAHERR